MAQAALLPRDRPGRGPRRKPSRLRHRKSHGLTLPLALLKRAKQIRARRLLPLRQKAMQEGRLVNQELEVEQVQVMDGLRAPVRAKAAWLWIACPRP